MRTTGWPLPTPARSTAAISLPGAGQPAGRAASCRRSRPHAAAVRGLDEPATAVQADRDGASARRAADGLEDLTGGSRAASCPGSACQAARRSPARHPGRCGGGPVAVPRRSQWRAGQAARASRVGDRIRRAKATASWAWALGGGDVVDDERQGAEVVVDRQIDEDAVARGHPPGERRQQRAAARRRRQPDRSVVAVWAIAPRIASPWWPCRATRKRPSQGASRRRADARSATERLRHGGSSPG